MGDTNPFSPCWIRRHRRKHLISHLGGDGRWVRGWTFCICPFLLTLLLPVSAYFPFVLFLSMGPWLSQSHRLKTLELLVPLPFYQIVLWLFSSHSILTAVSISILASQTFAKIELTLLFSYILLSLKKKKKKKLPKMSLANLRNLHISHGARASSWLAFKTLHSLGFSYLATFIVAICSGLIILPLTVIAASHQQHRISVPTI